MTDRSEPGPTEAGPGREPSGAGREADPEGSGSGGFDPAAVGSDGPPVDEKPYRVLFDANGCIGAGRCAEFSANWELDLSTGIARPVSFFLGEDELDANVRAAEACPANKGRGVIHVIDRRTGEEIAPDPHGDGTVSVDW